MIILASVNSSSMISRAYHIHSAQSPTQTRSVARCAVLPMGSSTATRPLGSLLIHITIKIHLQSRTSMTLGHAEGVYVLNTVRRMEG